MTHDADTFIDTCQQRFGPALAGLMCIPPANSDPAPHFQNLATLAARHGLATLSMGMSGDFETAITHGATHVRVGTALFGTRPSPINPHPRPNHRNTPSPAARPVAIAPCSKYPPSGASQSSISPATNNPGRDRTIHPSTPQT